MSDQPIPAPKDAQKAPRSTPNDLTQLENVSQSDKPAGKEYIRDRWVSFDRDYWLDREKMDIVADHFETEIDACQDRKRKRKGADREKFRATLKAILLDLLVSYQANPQTWLIHSRRKAWYTERGPMGTLARYHNPLVAYQPVISIMDGLQTLELVSYKLGFNDRREGGTGRHSRVRPKKALIDQLLGFGLYTNAVSFRDDRETLILRSKKERVGGHYVKEDLPYDDNDYTVRMRDNLRRINNKLAQTKITLNIPEADLKTLKREHQKKQQEDFEVGETQRPDFDLTSTRLRRIFSHGSFDLGGRFYGAWWMQFSEDKRSKIMINDTYTVELDFKSMHPRMLYDRIKTEPPMEDLYDLPEVLPSASPKDRRRMIKTYFQKLLNGKDLSRMNFDSLIDRVISLEDYPDFVSFAQAIMDQHPHLKPFFLSRVGLELQRIDSNIAERVMLTMLDGYGQTVLPIHDSFIVDHEYAQDLKDSMMEAYYHFTGWTPVIS
ncbi:hypothetical protein GCM10017044_05960 [Kordiimonas sediminis]|uniref:Uncharacterized protein n=1 Tax=Kordiimonas sediminis TaxID=1735581 RepID=A0A919ANP7_9PROT|nr:hypothetical protein [Kordiimonas sediminis]GHF14671.1 hypothetical protein GCM10017044_05960 [Kordiimonas sediminis]